MPLSPRRALIVAGVVAGIVAAVALVAALGAQVAACFDYQLGGAYGPPPGVRVVVRDRAAPPAPGSYGICYVNAFQTQPEETAWWQAYHDDLLLHREATTYVSDPDWPGEVLLDTSTAGKRQAIAAIVGGWIDGCARAGYQAVEPDNFDSWARSRSRLSREDNLELAKLLVDHAHRRGLAIAQKNAAEVAPVGRTDVGFDFAVVEECQVYDECDAYLAAYDGRVLEIEYTDNGRDAFAAACAARRGAGSVILRDRDLVPAGEADHVYEAC